MGMATHARLPDLRKLCRAIFVNAVEPIRAKVIVSLPPIPLTATYYYLLQLFTVSRSDVPVDSPTRWLRPRTRFRIGFSRRQRWGAGASPGRYNQRRYNSV